MEKMVDLRQCALDLVDVHELLDSTHCYCRASLSVSLQYGTDDISEGDGALWFAGKQMIDENKLSTHVGRHENTKAVVKLQKKGQGAPSREPVCF